MVVLSPIIFVLIKFFGYFYYLKLVSPAQGSPNLKHVAAIRLIFGIIVGMSIYALFPFGRDIFPVYFSAILLGRILIWYFIFHYFYTMFSTTRKVWLTIGGTTVSYLLDVPATIGILTIIGGIC